MRIRNGLLLCAAGLGLAACGGARKAAEQAIAAADSALAPVAAEAARVAPEALAPISSALEDAKSALASGDVARATEAAKAIPGKVAELSKTVDQMKKDYAADFATLSEAVPRNLAAVKEKLAKPPRSLSRERVLELEKGYDAATTEWAAIAQEYQGGAVASAMGKAFALKKRMSEAMVSLGLSSDEKAWGNLITQPK